MSEVAKCPIYILMKGFPEKLESPIEAWFYYAFKDRFPKQKIIQQAQIAKYRVDFLFIPQRLIVECDGEQFHNGYKDHLRDRELVKLGYRTLRFTGSQIYKEIIQKDTTGNTGGYDLVDVVKFYLDEREPKKKLAYDNYILQHSYRVQPKKEKQSTDH